MINFKLYSVIFIILMIFLPKSTFAAWSWVKCTPNEIGQIDVGTTNSRIHIRCTNPVMDNGNSIWFFSLPSTSNDASRLLDIAAKAIENNKSLTISFIQGDLSGAAYACNASNCRKPSSFLLDEASAVANTTVSVINGIIRIIPNSGIVKYCSNTISSSATSLGACTTIGNLGISLSGFEIKSVPNSSSALVVKRDNAAIFQCISYISGNTPLGTCKQIGFINN